MPKKIDLTGQRFGRLVVTKEAPRKITSGGNSIVCWYCNCDCGTKNKIIKSNSLRNGKTISCGCYISELASKRMSLLNKKYNKYDLTTHNYGIGWTNNTHKEFWFDKEDYDLIKNYCWYEHHNYIEAKIPNTNKHIALHKIIMHDEENKYDIDHINTYNRHDNRKNNLRIVTRSQNNTNKRIQKNNTSGVPGVVYNKTHNVWRATININKKQKVIDCKSFEEAVALRKELEKKYYGEYSYDNSQKIASNL